MLQPLSKKNSNQDDRHAPDAILLLPERPELRLALAVDGYVLQTLAEQQLRHYNRQLTLLTAPTPR
jgi:hypothetical protein